MLRITCSGCVIVVGLAILLPGFVVLPDLIRDQTTTIVDYLVAFMIMGCGALLMAFGIRRISTAPGRYHAQPSAPLPAPAEEETIPPTDGETSAATEQVQLPVSPPPGMPADAARMYQALIDLNAADKPFRIIDGSAREVDLIAEWKLVDKSWWDYFRLAGVENIFLILIRLDVDNRQVFTRDEHYSVSWDAGAPLLSLMEELGSAHMEASFFRGQTWGFQHEQEYTTKELLRVLKVLLLEWRWEWPQPVYSFTFSSSVIKKPIQNAIRQCGWKHRWG